MTVSVAIGVLAAIQFDDKLCFAASKIGYVRLDRQLPDEVMAAKAIGLDLDPKQGLRLGAIFPQGAGERCCPRFPA